MKTLYSRDSCVLYGVVEKKTQKLPAYIKVKLSFLRI